MASQCSTDWLLILAKPCFTSQLTVAAVTAAAAVAAVAADINKLHVAT